MRGAWIEITDSDNRKGSLSGRSPCGERGLKFAHLGEQAILNKSLPMRGAWIEIRKVVEKVNP